MASLSNEEAIEDAIALADIIDKTLLRGDDGRRRDEYESFPRRCYAGACPYDTNMIVGTFLKKFGVQLTIFLHDDDDGKVKRHVQGRNLIDGLEKHYGEYVTLVLGGSSDSIVDADDYITSMRDLLEFKRRHLEKVVASETSALASVSL
jgi:hypothetical protein